MAGLKAILASKQIVKGVSSKAAAEEKLSTFYSLPISQAEGYEGTGYGLDNSS
jgi:hypothetical protein